MPPPETFYYQRIAEAFRACGLDMPTARLVTLSCQLRTNLLAGGQYITAIPNSMLSLNVGGATLRRLPVAMPVLPFPVTIVTLKNRTLSPVVERFIESIREVRKSNTDPGRCEQLKDEKYNPFN